MQIDWEWVKKELLEKERVAAIQKDASKDIIRQCLDETIEEAKSYIRPRVAQTIKRIIALAPASIEVEGDIKLSSAALSSHIKGATHIHIFLVTIGNALEEAATSAMSKGDMLRGYFLDKIGSFAVESLAENLEEELRKTYMDQDKSISVRFSPGYCDWILGEQYKLDKILDFSRAGIRLTEGCMMVPRKSISAIVGIGPKERFIKTKSSCGICSKTDCDYRKAC